MVEIIWRLSKCDVRRKVGVICFQRDTSSELGRHISDFSGSLDEERTAELVLVRRGCA